MLPGKTTMPPTPASLPPCLVLPTCPALRGLSPARSAACRVRTAALAVLATLSLVTQPVAFADEHAALVELHTRILKADAPFPRFRVDAAWPQMPADLIIGQVSGVAVDRHDEVWIVHRPHSLHPTATGLVTDPPITRDCCRPAKVVVRFARNGRLLDMWGDETSAPVIDGVRQFPASVHGIFVTDADEVWIAGNGDGDHAIYNFTRDGRFLRTIGRREDTRGNLDRHTLGRPADIYAADGQILVADGYTNRRVIRFENADGEFGGYFGAFGEAPEPIGEGEAALYDPAAEQFSDMVHCVVSDGDGIFYVCDRRNTRVQVFRQQDDGNLAFLRTIPISPGGGGPGSATDVALSPDGRFVYVADMVNSRIWILDRRTDDPIAAIGRIGRQAGQFIWLHSIDVDSKGNLYATEVSTGQRVQKLVITEVR